MVNVVQALSSVYFTEATFPADLDTKEDDASSVSTETQNALETTTITDNTAKADTTTVLDSTPAPKHPNPILYESATKRRKTNHK